MLIVEILENPRSEGAKPKPERRRENADLPFATNVHTTNKPDKKGTLSRLSPLYLILVGQAAAVDVEQRRESL